MKRCVCAVGLLVVIEPPSRPFTDSMFVKHDWEPFLSTDIGLRRTDGETHYPSHMWLRSRDHVRTYKRSDEAWAKVAARKAEKRAELRAKKKARLTREDCAQKCRAKQAQSVEFSNVLKPYISQPHGPSTLPS